MIAVQLLVFCFGLLIGSFLNVVIHRLPEGKSVVFPRSRCPKCETTIKWSRNIPLASFLFLKGKCAECDAPIGLRYPAVELLTGLFAVLLFPSPASPLEIGHMELLRFAVEFSIAAVFLAHFIIDIEHQLLPDKLNLYLLAVVLPYSALANPLYHWIGGGVIGFFGPYLITLFFYKIKGQMGLGGGDIKLFGILGVLLGPQGIMNTIFVSSLFGSATGLILIASKKMDKNTPLSFGPYIIVVAACQIFFPEIFARFNPFGFN